MKNIAVLYHAECLDGFSSAWVFWRRFKNSAEYIPIKHGNEPPLDILTGKKVFLLDFCFERPQMLQILNVCKNLVLLDHHRSSLQALDLIETGQIQGAINLNISGCFASWEYLNGSEPKPNLLHIVNDYDMRCFKYPNTRYITTALKMKNKSFRFWDEVVKDGIHKLYREGENLHAHLQLVARNICQNPKQVKLFSCSVPIVNCSMQLKDYVGDILCHNQPFSICFTVENNKVFFSLRSNPNYEFTVDVSEVASRFPNGGGHKHSAGFVGDLSMLRKILND